jgi:hypothetical protein
VQYLANSVGTPANECFRSTFMWLNQFWLFGFQTAKNWGRGPRDWTADTLGFNNHRGSGTLSLPSTPGLNAESPRASDPGEKGAKVGIKPSQLCRWSIHVPDEEYEAPSPPSDDEYDDGQNENSGEEWPQSWVNHPIEEKVVNALQSNSFSSLSVDELPFSTAKVASAASKSPNEILVETVGFSIIAGNLDLLETLLIKARSNAVDLSSLYPFHLAISYLRGSKTCCNILDLLHDRLPREDRPGKIPFNSVGHTVIDNLMIAILKSHTSTASGFVDRAFATDDRFIGEEVDICGRWDADSECYRDLLASGRSSIPFEWKHKFCHTSAQAIVHCLDTVMAWNSRAQILKTPSGLFLRYCSDCGRKLQLLPLHALVLTAFQLARNGCKGEDLFGALACLLSLLSNGADPCATAQISITALLEVEANEKCPHEELSPINLAEQVPEAITSTWPMSARNGWHLFCLVLRKSHNERTLQDLDALENKGDSDLVMEWRLMGEIDKLFSDTCDFHWNMEIPSCFGESAYLGHIWASVQAELLSYRRLKGNDPWTSEYFEMEKLLGSLELGDGISLGFLEQDMLQTYCRCGRFRWDTPHREQTAKYYFGNLDDYTRLTAIPLPGRQCKFACSFPPFLLGADIHRLVD